MEDRPGADRPWVLLYDGACCFCKARTDDALRYARPGTVEARDMNLPGALGGLPPLDPEQVKQSLHLVGPDGRVFRGAEAVARLLMTRRALGVLGRLYYVPGLRQLSDRAYAWVAHRRYGFGGQAGGGAPVFLAALLAIAAAGAGCSGGGGSAAAPATPAALQVLSVTPQGQSVAVNATVSVVFNRAVDPATVSTGPSGKLRVVPVDAQGTATGPAIAGTAVVSTTDARRVDIQPAAALDGLQDYRLHVTTAVHDLNGVGLAAEHLHSFKTGTAPDTTAPVFNGASSATATSSSAIQLGWAQATDDTTTLASAFRYRVYRSTATGFTPATGNRVAEVTGALSHNDTGLSANTAYFYVVRAVDEAGNEDGNLTEVTDTTDPTPPPAVSYANDVQPLWNGTCTGCHPGNGGLSLAAGVSRGQLVNQPASGCTSETRVIPGKPDDSYLVKKLEGTSGICGSRMPVGGPFLSASQVATVRDWISQGALDN